MVSNQRVIALIPARAGSKRLVNKNLLDLCGKPLIAWSIQSALESTSITDVIVSTDSGAIKSVAENFGAKVPFIRPDYLSSDIASTDDVILHSIEELSLSESDIVVLLQPTSPLRNSDDIDSAIKGLSDEDIMGTVSVCECEHSPLWSNTLSDENLMDSFISDDLVTKRSQDLPTYYRLNGAIYAYRVSFFLKHKKRIYSKEIKATIMPVERSVDIDNVIDFKLAECLMKD
ncbi:acylneuraminate cytidylyltransferase family protein [Aliivibrio fischeri]|uniref:acylneuraminate cytidylyltransferase family protein n=1 Tax=Aliivibrio fischeri TaxID=668 RepID=UPI0012DA1138|nr:acylneuraminate cytidylyltransferase family protein [Aliivibrio fischeri]MUK39984.1 acylneuraminate cytidylyltransferase family protein [Aliivibrio fischeri]